MDFSSTEKNGIVIIELKGAILGGPEATALNEYLHHLIDNGKKNVVVDVSNVDLMNSSGLGMLIGGYTTMTNAGGGLKLAAANEKIQNLITITKLHTIFLAYTTVDEAVASY